MRPSGRGCDRENEHWGASLFYPLDLPQCPWLHVLQATGQKLVSVVCTASWDLISGAASQSLGPDLASFSSSFSLPFTPTMSCHCSLGDLGLALLGSGAGFPSAYSSWVFFIHKQLEGS